MILGGGRDASGGFEFYNADDSTVNSAVGDTLRRFLPAVFPGKYEEGREPEMEWVNARFLLSCCETAPRPLIHEY